MKYLKILVLIFAMTFSSCESKGQKPDNTKPMYGEVAKSEAYRKIDTDFKNESLSKFKTIDSAVAVQINQAWRYYYHNDLKTAMKRFNQAWLLNPEFPDSYFGFAALLASEGNVSESNRFFNLAEERDKTKERAKVCYQRIADCKEQLQDIKGTIAAYKKLSELSTTSIFAYKKLGYFYMKTANVQEALMAYGKAIDLDPSDATTFNNRGYLQQTEKNYKDAIVDYSKAILLNPKYISAYVNRGIIEMELGNFENAKRDFTVCVSLDAQAGELRRFLALSKLNLKDKIGACAELQIAKHLGDTEANTLLQQNCQ